MWWTDFTDNSQNYREWVSAIWHVIWSFDSYLLSGLRMRFFLGAADEQRHLLVKAPNPVHPLRLKAHHVCTPDPNFILIGRHGNKQLQGSCSLRTAVHLKCGNTEQDVFYFGRCERNLTMQNKFRWNYDRWWWCDASFISNQNTDFEKNKRSKSPKNCIWSTHLFLPCAFAQWQISFMDKWN